MSEMICDEDLATIELKLTSIAKESQKEYLSSVRSVDVFPVLEKQLSDVTAIDGVLLSEE